MPKMSSTPSALRLSIKASAALIREAMVAAGLCLASRRFCRVPAGSRVDRGLDGAAFVALDHMQHRLDQLLAEKGRLEPEVEQLRVGGVVVMIFLLDPGILVVLDLDPVAEVLAGLLDEPGQLDHRELLGELVEDTEVTGLGGRADRELDAPEGVADVEETADLVAAAVDR